jgi:hypothetical protein
VLRRLGYPLGRSLEVPHSQCLCPGAPALLDAGRKGIDCVCRSICSQSASSAALPVQLTDSVAEFSPATLAMASTVCSVSGRTAEQQPRPPPACHGVNACSRNRGALSPPAPRTPFSPAPGSTRTSTLPAYSARSPILGTAFRSPVTAAPLGASIPGSTVPACSFGSRPTSSRTVRPQAPQPGLVSPSPGCFYASDPFPDLHRPAPAFSDASTPLQELLTPKGSTRSTPVQPDGPACRSRPISFRSPPPASFG